MKVAVASKNPVKIDATRIALEKVFPEDSFEMEWFSVDSEVSDQPMTDTETYQWAENRVHNLKQVAKDFDLYVGLEWGLEKKYNDMECFAWIVVKDNSWKMWKAKTSTFFLPTEVCKLIDEWKELWEADDIVFSRTNSKQSNGAVWILTKDIITRTTYYVEAVVLALIPFINKELY